MTDGRAIMSLPIADIVIGPRIGFYHAEHAARIGGSMASEGQHDPIHVKRNGNAAKVPWTLVAGLHRLRGAEGNGWSNVDAIQVAEAGATDADLRRLELSENADHLQRRPIERAIMMAEYARLEEAIDHPGKVGEAQHVRGGRVRQSAAVTVTAAPDWRARTALAFDVSVSTLERHQRIYRAIFEALPDLAQALNDHSLGASLANVRTLAKIKDDAARRRISEMLLSRSDWKSIDEVLIAAGSFRGNRGFRVDPRNYKAVMASAWGDMQLREKRAYLETEFPSLLTKDMAEKLVIRLVQRFKL